MFSYKVGEIHPLITSIGNNMMGTCPGRIIEVREDGTMVIEAIGLARATRHLRTVADMVQADSWDRDLKEKHDSERRAEDAWLRVAENNWGWS